MRPVSGSCLVPTSLVNCGVEFGSVRTRVEMACAAARSPADQDRFICIYPAYLNNKKTIAEGRRIPIEKAVENPTATEIQDVCLAVGLNAFLEKNKMYSREWNRDVQYRGRVRVQLKQEDGSLCLIQFPSRKSVMLYAAEMIPKLKTRTQKTGGGDQSLQQGEGSKKEREEEEMTWYEKHVCGPPIRDMNGGFQFVSEETEEAFCMRHLTEL